VPFVSGPGWLPVLSAGGGIRLASSADSGDDTRWRVFISHTSELRNFPKGKSYVAAVERAVSAAGHVVVNMADFAAADQVPALVCAEFVRGCDVYVGVLGTRYGSPVRDQPEMSYTELEFETATEASLDRLVFLLDEDAEEPGIPTSALIDREFGTRQDAFRRRVQDSGLLTRSFASPAGLGQLVERSLRDLADTRARLASGIQREQVPAGPQLVRASRFVNPPPATAPTWFQDRQVETGLLAKYVSNPGIRLVWVCGRGGIGKTAMVCRLLKGLEAGRIPDVEGDPANITVGGIVYLSRNGVHQVEYPTLVADLLRLLPADATQHLQRIFQNPRYTPVEMMLALLESFPAGEPVVVLLDNLESVMDTEQETLAEQALGEALIAVLTAPAHAVTVIATSRVRPSALCKVEPARQRQLQLDEGLGSPDAQTVLREIDDDGRLGLRDAPEELLDGLRQHTRGFPRALEAVKAILDGDATITPKDLLDRTRHLPEDEVVQVLVGEAYDLLDAPAKQVMQALAVYPAPASPVGVDFLLRPVNPTIDSAPILTRLVRRQLARFRDGRYYLHPIDRDYARSQLPATIPGYSPATFSLAGLQTRAADYYAQVRTPQESWHTLEDVRPQLAEFELRCDTGDSDMAAVVLAGIDFGYLQVWGHCRTLVELHRRIYGRVTNPTLNAVHLTNLGLCQLSLGDYPHAIDMFTQVLAIARDIRNRQGEATALSNLGNCHFRLGDYRQAIDLHTRALTIAREIGDRQSVGVRLANLANCQVCLGDYRQAIGLHTQALAIARDIGNRQLESADLDVLGVCHYRLGDYRRAIELHTQALAIARDIGTRPKESIALGNLGLCHAYLGDYRQAIELHTQALAIARDTGDLYGEAIALDYLGRASLASGDARRALMLLDQAVKVADASGSLEPVVEARCGLARAQLRLGDPGAAEATVTARRELRYPAEEPTMRLLEGLALLDLRRLEDSVRAFRDALVAADALLALADNNIAALHARGLALSGLAAAAGDPVRAREAGEAFTLARAVTSAAGVTADTRRLFNDIARHDRSGILSEVPGTQNP
jgi:tetratricopeptide (TPR) repeat protein